MLFVSVDRGMFIRLFENYGRASKFGYDGLTALYEYLMVTSESLGEPIEVDVIALDSCYVRYESLEEMREEGYAYETLEELEESYPVIRIDDTAFITVQH